MAPNRKDDNEKENQEIYRIVENLIEQIIPDLIERILTKTSQRIPKPETSVENAIAKKASQFLKLVGTFNGMTDGYDFLCTVEAMFLTMNTHEEV